MLHINPPKRMRLKNTNVSDSDSLDQRMQFKEMEIL